MTHPGGKVALVIGAGSGIDKVTAVLLAQHGARVVALAHTEFSDFTCGLSQHSKALP